MCSCQTNTETSSDPGAAQSASGVSLRVADMSCGHCVKTITGAIESAVPGARVKTDLASHVVSVEGADMATVSGIITQAGYTPTAL